jgi:hypothetical protein
MSKKTEMTSSGLRSVLFQEIDNLRSKKSTPQEAQAMARLATQIIGTARLEIDYNRQLGRSAPGIEKSEKNNTAKFIEG